jgi:hypothetical protein
LVGLNHLTLPVAILDLQIDDPQYQGRARRPLSAKGRIAGYRIGEDQSGGNGTILQPVSRCAGDR